MGPDMEDADGPEQRARPVAPTVGPKLRTRADRASQGWKLSTYPPPSPIPKCDALARMRGDRPQKGPKERASQGRSVCIAAISAVQRHCQLRFPAYLAPQLSLDRLCLVPECSDGLTVRPMPRTKEEVAGPP
jgi:hypothetical protein